MSRRSADARLFLGLKIAGAFSALILGAIVAFTLLEAWPAIRAIGLQRLLSDPSWHPLSAAYNMGPMIAGSIAISGVAVLIAAPLGVAVGALEQFYLDAHHAAWVRRIVEVMSGIPSVVIGLWGLVVLVPLVARIKPPGTSLIAAALVLALMLVPTIAYFSAIAFERAGRDLRDAAQALGLSRRTLIWQIASPLAKRSIAAGIVLALARAIGETMMVLMVAGNVANWPDSLLAPVRTLTANMALEMAYAEGLHRSALFLSGVLVMAVALALVTLASSLMEEPDAAS